MQGAVPSPRTPLGSAAWPMPDSPPVGQACGFLASLSLGSRRGGRRLPCRRPAPIDFGIHARYTGPCRGRL